MSDIKTRLDEDIKTAMRGKDKPRLAALRLIAAAVKQVEVDERVTVDDGRMLDILDKMAKQRRDSIAQYEQAGRRDLAEQERFELRLIGDYLPKPLTEDEVAALIDAAIADAGAESMRDMGKVMGRLRPLLQGRADMSQAGAQVKARLG